MGSATNVSCNGGSNGAATVTAGGGAGSYTYSWSPSGGTGASATGLSAGTYTVTVTDANSCTATKSVTLTQPSAIAVTNVSQTAIACNGGYATVTITASGGTAPLYYTAAEITNATGIYAGLGANTGYTYSVTDANGCPAATGTFNVTEPAPLTASVSPTSGAVGSTVTISGSNFTGATGVSFNGTTATNYTVNNNGQITVTVPSGATTGPVTVTVGECEATTTEDFTIVPSGSGITLNVKAYMQGYYAGSGVMTSVLSNQLVSSNTNEVDTITIELRDAATGANIEATANGVIMIDGTVSLNFPSSVQGNNYYIVFKHRNTIQTWSAAPVTMASVTSYDFTTAASKAYGDNMIEIETGVFAMYTGDMNQDEYIDPFDFSLYIEDNNNLATGYYNTDLNGDGYVDPFDFSIYIENNNNLIYSAHP